MNILTLQSDYPILSLTRLSEPVRIVEVPVIDIQVVEGIEGIVVDEEEEIGVVTSEEELIAAIVEEEAAVGVMETEDDIGGSVADEEGIIGVVGDCDDL